MTPAFLTPTFPAKLAAARSTTSTSTSSSTTLCPSRQPARMLAARTRVASKDPIINFDDDSDLPAPVDVPEVTAVSAAVCEFMNKEHVRDIANYVVHFGRQFNDLSQLTAVKMTNLDAAGFTADVVSCDDTSHCVCVQERLDWPLGLCTSANDVISALKHLSMACGLPADF